MELQTQKGVKQIRKKIINKVAPILRWDSTIILMSFVYLFLENKSNFSYFFIDKNPLAITNEHQYDSFHIDFLVNDVSTRSYAFRTNLT